MSLVLLLVVVRVKLVQISRTFLYEGQNEKRKLHHLKWDIVIKPKKAGGVSLENLEFKNWSLLAKWWWRFGEGREALWRKAAAEKYGKDEWGWDPS